MIAPIVTNVKGFLLTPVESFQQTRNDNSGAVFAYFSTLLLFNAILSALIAAGFSIGSMQGFTGMSSGFPVPVMVFFMALVGSFFMTLILAAWIHLWVYLFGGRRGIMQTFKAIIYGNTPYLLLGWIPFIGFIFVFWSLVLGILGVRELQEISTRNAILAVVIAFITLLIPLILVVAYLMTSNMVFVAVPVLPVNQT